MYVGTIHAWCLNVLQENKYEYQKFSVLDEIKLKLFVDRNFYKIGMKDLNMEKFIDTKHFVQLMGILREAEFTDRSAVPEKLFAALSKYESVLTSHCYLDFTMIMSKAIHYLKSDTAFRQKIQRSIGYLIVDEYQDVNPIQENIVRELYSMGANVCVVGDDDQTIFQWRGSHIDYIRNFTTRYNNVESVILDDNFRSSNAIVDVALNVISNNSKRLDKEMVAKGFQQYDRGDILYNQFDSTDDENQFIATSIKNLRGVTFKDKETGKERGLDYSDMVILIRKWKKADNIITALKDADIPFIVTGVNNLFQQKEVRAAKSIFDYLANQVDRSVVIDYWKDLCPLLEDVDLKKACDYLDKNHPSKNDYYERFNIQQIFHDFLDKANIKEDLFKVEDSSGTSGYVREEVVFYNLGMFSQIINDFETIYFKTDSEPKLKAFLSFLQYSADDYYPEGWLNNSYKTPNAVQIMTIYQAKGLEYPVVFIPGLNKNYLPSNQPTGKQVWHFIDKSHVVDVDRYFPREEDERRLLYVAITRSKKYLLMSRAPDGRMQGKESLFGAEIRKSEYVFSSKDRDYSERATSEPKSASDISNISLSFSLLKAFFDCPYSFKFYTFYGFQNPLGARIGYGSGIHNTLMEIHREFLEGTTVSREDLPGILEKHINFPYATPTIIEGLTTKAKEAIDIYYDSNASEFSTIEFAEKEIQIDLGDGILVNGKMDLIKKKHLDGTVEKTIIDFKSTEDAQAYNATIDQLQLYSLGYKQLTGENADFLQIYNLDTNEAHKNELSVKDMDKMREKIVAAANDIRTNNLDHTCNDPKCVCRFKK